MTLEKIAKKFYSNIENAKIIIGGDGAAWIREASRYWLNSNYILDKFHAMRYLKQIFPNWKNQLNYSCYQSSKALFETGDFEELISQLKEIKVKPEKEEKLAKIISYFTNNSIGVNNQKLEWNIGVSAEGDISHIVKWLLGYGSKALNHQTFKNMLCLKAAEVNKVDVLTFIKNHYKFLYKNN